MASKTNANQYIHDNEFVNPMANLVSLKQITTVEEFYKEFEALINLLQRSEAYALSIFVSDLKPNITKSVRLFQPKNLTHALHLAKQMEAIIYNPPRKIFLPYSKPTYLNSPHPNLQTPFKPQQFTKAKILLGLPTQKTHMLPYTNQTKSFNLTNSRKL